MIREDQTYQKRKQSNDCIITEDACERGELGVRLDIQRKGAETQAHLKANIVLIQHGSLAHKDPMQL